MIDIAKLREDPEAVRENIKKKFQDHKLVLVDEIIDLDVKSRQAQAKADTALQQANTFTNQRINQILNGASSNYDTFKEIEELLKNNDNLTTVLKKGIAGKTGKVAKEIGNGTATEFTVTHNLNTQDVVVMVRENKAPFAQVITDVEVTDVNNIKVKFAKPPKANEYKVVIVG